MPTVSPPRFIVLFGLVCLLSPPAAAEPWPGFRGNDSTGHLPEASIPDRWSAADYLWQIDLGGDGNGSPAVWEDRVFVLAADSATARRTVMAIDLASGREVWSESFDSKPHHLHPRNNYASSTPACNAERVVFAWSDPEQTLVKCFDHAGQPLWSVDLGVWKSQHGFGTSPLIVDDRVYLLNSQQAEELKEGEEPGRSHMVALDLNDGSLVWETPLVATRSCYGKPAVFRPEGERPQLVAANTGNGLFGLDLETGELLWSNQVFGARCVSAPVIAGDLILGTAGTGGGGNHLVAVRPQGNQAPEAYRIERGAPYVPTPALADGRLYLCADNGIATCVDAATGSPIWSRRIGGNYSVSPLVLGDKVLMISLDGQATVLRHSDQFQQIASFDLEGPVQATPAYSNGSLLLRIGNRLCCLGPKGA